MRATEFIRSILDLIDLVDQNGSIEQEITIEPMDCADPTPEEPQADLRRFRQIVDLSSANATQHANEPNEAYADISAVTTDAGGGVNGPKNPADIRANSISMYPAFQARSGE